MNSSAIIATSEKPEWPRVRVNGVPLDPKNIALEMQYHPAESRDEAVFLAAQALVIRELLEQRAAELDLLVMPEADESEEEALFRVLIEREVLIPEADEATLVHYYESNPARFTTAPLLAARHILLAAAPDDIVERSRLRDTALALIAELQAAPDRFADLARRHSACPSKEQGGELGQLSPGQTVPEFERQLMRLPEGLSLQPLESRFGFHVVWVDMRIEGRKLPYELVRDDIRRELAERVGNKAVVQYLETLVGQAEIDGILMRGADTPLLQ
ncbi:peptidylprolyl isomerase [Pseudomonas sp.]|uniref:peptidylprolyl isomerase n=1 Tax=Pseudomonas sp. TaxID=306 RepID=UPI00272CBA91|nr:peptidylprolyl isomerase [Pseudomonas sp.]